ncbi:PEP-CTERM sorting domain-containing protein [Aquincola sp. MAHUQ-54]|uniref:PEP-CTERM sorting domain-containing protein n=1 Tax=Aquincola agrisoli TaxID=3119538 RepID=A0AAW9QQY1_9BURK
MNRSIATLALMAAATAAAQAQTTIAAGGTVSGAVTANTSIYQIFGHSGSQPSAAADAPYLAFAPGADRVFTFTAMSGGVTCCGPATWYGLDGGGGTTRVNGINGLSGVQANTALPLVAVFTTDADPFGGAAPANLPAWTAAGAASVAPALHQVFVIGDGRAGVNNAAGALLSYTAPEGATRLYLGFADSWSFQGNPGYYADNLGGVNYTVALAPVPEPASVALMAAGGLLLGAVRRRRSR